MLKILVTGSTGFIGVHLLKSLVDTPYTIYGTNSKMGDIAVSGTWDQYPPADVVIHLAGKSFVPASWKCPEEFIQCNLMGTVNALNFCKKHNAKLIYLSSYLYGNPISLPIPETAGLVTPNPYALSKKMAEEACKFYANSFEIDVTILRPFNVYGLGQSKDFLVPLLVQQIKNGEDIHIKDLNPKRDYVYITDLVNAIIAAIPVIKNFNIFNIGSGESYSVAELIQLMQQIVKTNLNVFSSDERRRDEIMNTIADISNAKKILNWKPNINLEAGLTELLHAEA